MRGDDDVGVFGNRLGRLAFGDALLSGTGTQREGDLVALALLRHGFDLDDGVIVLVHKRSDIKAIALGLGQFFGPKLDCVGVINSKCRVGHEGFPLIVSRWSTLRNYRRDRPVVAR